MSNGDNRWGKTPFRIGLWVGGSTTPNWTAIRDEAVKTVHRQADKKRPGAVGGGGIAPPTDELPWCGSKIDCPGKLPQSRSTAKGRGRTLIYCGDKFGQCKFSRKAIPGRRAAGHGGG